MSSINDVQHLTQNGYMTYFSSSFYLLLRFPYFLLRIYGINCDLHDNDQFLMLWEIFFKRYSLNKFLYLIPIKVPIKYVLL